MISHAPSDQPLLEFYETTFLPLRLADWSDSTKAHYVIAIGHLKKHLGRDPLVTDLRDDVVSDCLAGLQSRGLSPSTVNAYRAQLVALANCAFRMSVIRETLNIPRLAEPRRAPNVLSVRQFECLIAAGRATPCRDPTWDRRRYHNTKTGRRSSNDCPQHTPNARWVLRADFQARASGRQVGHDR